MSGSGTGLVWLELLFCAKTELWGKASLGLLRKSGTTEDGEVLDTGLLEVSSTTLVSTFSTGDSDMEAGSVEDLLDFCEKVENDAEVGTADVGDEPTAFVGDNLPPESVASTAALLAAVGVVTLSTLLVSLGDASS